MTLKAYFGKNGLFSDIKNFSDFKVASGMAISDFFSSTTAKVVGLTNSIAATAATTGQAAATGTLAVAEEEAAATGRLSAMMTSLSATMSKLWTTVLAPILSNPLTWAIAIGAAAIAFYSSTNILPFQ